MNVQSCKRFKRYLTVIMASAFSRMWFLLSCCHRFIGVLSLEGSSALEINQGAQDKRTTEVCSKGHYMRAHGLFYSALPVRCEAVSGRWCLLRERYRKTSLIETASTGNQRTCCHIKAEKKSMISSAK